ncbi:MAG: CHAT domain-containing protein [Chloroflexota bacterium]|nr:CHAT domain-containing protein [Chloroflexota bacterium]
MSSVPRISPTKRPVLRIMQTARRGDIYTIQLYYRDSQHSHTPITTNVTFSLTSQEQEQLRWYLEDYLEHPTDPAPKIAANVEKKMQEVGEHLFNSLFDTDRDARFLWADLHSHLNDTRVEVISGVETTTIPWELMRDPHTGTLLALRARDFVRGLPNPALQPSIPQTESGPIRILLVICRPGGRNDVPFRSVASRIVKSLSEEARAHFQLDVLRPPTYDRLAQVLRAAKDAGRPYHVVHFDGHGVFLDVQELFDNWDKQKKEEEIRRYLEELRLIGFDPARFSPHVIYPRQPIAGQRGYLLFENPESEYNNRLVDGPDLGALLREADVPLLVLNACRSAHAEAAPAPDAVGDGTEPGEATRTKTLDAHAKVRAYGSLAQEVMDAGVTGVVAMRYNVYVVTAAQFVADLYSSLVRGSTLGEAVRVSRRHLHDNPLRSIAHKPLPLQDWSVPVVYEAAPIALFPGQQDDGALNITIHAAETAQARGALDKDLPKPPDVGFYGRDETLLAVDRAFDNPNHRIVLLHAFAGSGKTTTASEFARWYDLTGGVEGRVFFTSFEQPKPLARVLDQVGQEFGPDLEENGIHWLALDEGQRRQMALQLLRLVPVLWIWDNVEPVAGFPEGTPATLSQQEQKELADFLRDAQTMPATQAKFLLTSRRDERGWLGDHLPARVTMPPMPMQERLELAKALAGKYGKRIDDVEDWRPLLRYTGGNPLTITVVVGQALRDNLSTKKQIEAYVARLRAGEAAFEDEEESEGRSKSLGASLSYGFTHAFNDEERRHLALLHLFQGTVDVNTLRVMGSPKAEWSLPAVRGLSREAGVVLLDRAAEVGLLTNEGRGYYTIHPALPWFFKGLFDSCYGDNPATPVRAYVEAMRVVGDYYHDQFGDGNREVIGALAAEEENLLHARQLARANGWWGPVTSAMQGLSTLYNYTGRRGEWQRLVEEIVPDFVDPDTGGPLSGREEQWRLVIQYRVFLTREARQWKEAERLQHTAVEWDRKHATPLLALPPEELDGVQRNTIRTLAVSVVQLGQIQREQGKEECRLSYEEGYDLALRIDDKPLAAITAFNLGHGYMGVPALRDLDEAERWYNRSLELHDERDSLGRGTCYGQLGLVAYDRFQEARDAEQPEEELLRQLNDALGYYRQCLDLLPPGAMHEMAVTHNQLGNIFIAAGSDEYFGRALHHWQESIRYKEAQGNLYDAAVTQRNIAVALAIRGRFEDALLYAGAALRNYTDFGPGAAAEVQTTQELIAAIEELKNQHEGG